MKEREGAVTETQRKHMMEVFYLMRLWSLVVIATANTQGGSPGNTYPSLTPLMLSNLILTLIG